MVDVNNEDKNFYTKSTDKDFILGRNNCFLIFEKRLLVLGSIFKCACLDDLLKYLWNSTHSDDIENWIGIEKIDVQNKLNIHEKGKVNGVSYLRCSTLEYQDFESTDSLL